MRLADYLEAEARRPWVWGSADCTTFAGDWVLAQTGADPLAKWRGYSSEADVELLIAEAGGLLALWSDGLSGILDRINEPLVGAVGVITMPGEDGYPIEVGAIFTGKRWTLRTPRGIAGCSLDPSNVVAIWAK